MYISLIIPFHNSELKSNRILKTLSKLDDNNIEIILVDDGSIDNTYNKLLDFKKKSPLAHVIIIKQENKGPGGARNTGLVKSRGKYVWFIDSDDDINPEILSIIKNNYLEDYDFVEFVEKEDNKLIDSMEIPSGIYTNKEQFRESLITNFGRLHSKIFKRNMLLDNNIYYPEYCYYEDNALAFTLPFFPEKFLKIDDVGYIYQLDTPSITRSKPSLRSLDRLYTARLGLSSGLKYSQNEKEASYLKEKFITLFLINTLGMYKTILPSSNWITTWRIMKYYRTSVRDFNIKIRTSQLLKEKNLVFKSYFYFHWVMSHLILRDQKKHFDAIRKKAWNLT